MDYISSGKRGNLTPGYNKYVFAADVILLMHFAFVVFVLFGFVFIMIIYMFFFALMLLTFWIIPPEIDLKRK